MSNIQRFLYSSIPGLVVLGLVMGVAMAMGGSIAALIAGFVLGAAFLVNIPLLILSLIVLKAGSRRHLLLAGTVTYLLSIAIVLGLWDLSGPTQIM